MCSIREIIFSIIILVAIFSSTNGLNASITLSKRILNGNIEDPLPVHVFVDDNATNITLFDALVEAKNKSEISYNFTYSFDAQWGFFIESIGGKENNVNESLYWFIYSVNGNCERSLETGVSSTLIKDGEHYLFWYKKWVNENTLKNVNITLSKWILNDRLDNHTIDIHLTKNDTCDNITLYNALTQAAIQSSNYTFVSKNSNSAVESLGGLNESASESLYWSIYKLYADGEHELENGLSQIIETGERYVFWYKKQESGGNAALNRFQHCSAAIYMSILLLISFTLSNILK